MKNNYTNQTIVYSSSVVISSFVDWLIIFLLPRFTSFSDAGLYTIAFTISDLFLLLATFQTRNYQVISGYKDCSEKSFFSLRLYTTIGSFFIFVLFLVIFGYSEVTFVCIFLYLINKSILSIAEVTHGSLQLENRLDLVGIVIILYALSKFLFLIPILALTHKFMLLFCISMFVSGIVYFLFSWIFYYIVFKRQPYYNFSFSKEIFITFKSSFFVFLSSIITILITSLPKIILQKNCGEELLGVYSALTGIYALIPLLACYLYSPFIKQISSFCRNGLFKKVISILLIFEVITVITIGLVIFFDFIVGKKMLLLIYGVALEKYIYITSYYLINIFFYISIQFLFTLLICLNDNKSVIAISSFIIILLIILSPFLVIKYNVMGAVLSQLIVNFFSFLFIIFCTIIRLNCKAKKAKRNIKKEF